MYVETPVEEGGIERHWCWIADDFRAGTHRTRLGALGAWCWWHVRRRARRIGQALRR